MVVSRAIKILCADDNEHVRDALAMRFQFENDIECIAILESADNLVAKVREQSPDVIVLDLDMPGSDTFAAMRELSASNSRARIVVFSGHISPKTIEKALDAGVWGYVSKSDGEEALISAVREVMEGAFVMSPDARRAFQAP